MATTSNYSWPTPDDTDLVRDGAEAIRDLGNAIDATVAGIGSTILQVATATLTSDFSTTSNTAVTTGLEISFTPISDSSTLIIETFGRGTLYRAAGTPLSRNLFLTLRDNTGAVNFQNVVLGRDLIGSSGDGAASYFDARILGIQSSASTSARTYQLLANTTDTNNTLSLTAGGSMPRAIMVITEVA